MLDYTIFIRSGPPGYADTDEERISIQNEDELTDAVKEALKGYTYIRNVKIFCDQDPEKRNLCEMNVFKMKENVSVVPSYF